MKTKFLIIIAVLLYSCKESPISVEQTNNPNFNAEYLFSIDSCKIYRFVDDRTHYITICPCMQTTTDPYSEYNAGTKTHREYDDEIQTVYKKQPKK